MKKKYITSASRGGKEKIDWSILSKYRLELFGISTVAVLCVHAVPYIEGINYPFSIVILKVMSYGGIGVNIFLFLSGIGLSYSMKKRSDKRAFYLNRIKRTLLPYLFISVIAYFIIDVVLTWKPLYFLYDLSLFSFWFEHRGAWYIAMIIPIYALFPFYFQWLQSRENRSISIGICIGISILCTELLHYYNMPLYKHLQNILVGIPVFLLGIYFSEAVFEKQKIRIKVLFLLMIPLAVKLLFQIPKDSSMHQYAIAFVSIPICIFIAFSIHRLHSGIVGKILRFFGEYSLELYLTNIYIKWMFEYVTFNSLHQHWGDEVYQSLKYMVIIILGMSSGVLLKRLLNNIEKQLKRFNNRMKSLKEVDR